MILRFIIAVILLVSLGGCSTVTVESESISQHVAHGVGQAASAVIPHRGDATVYTSETRARSTGGGVLDFHNHSYSQRKTATGNEEGNPLSWLCLPSRALAASVSLRGTVDGRRRDIPLINTRVFTESPCAR
jgi:hypothetical protein